MGSNIPDPNWSERDDRNAENAPLGWPPGLPAKIEQIGRMMMGAIKRFWNKSNPVYLTTGAADAYVVTPEGQTNFLNLYEIIRVRIDRANTTTTPTLKFSATNARVIVKIGVSGTIPVVAGDMQAGRDHSFWFNGTNFILSNPATVDSSVTVGLLKAANNLSDVLNASTALSNLGGAPLASPTFTGTVTVSAINITGAINIAGLTASSAVATDASKNLISVTNTGTGSNVLATSPALAGTPTAPTAAQGTNSTQLATTAFVTTAVAATAVRVQVFNAGGTYTPNANMLYAVIECVGAGGGGGGCSASAAGQINGAGGGGAGAYSRSYVSKATVGASQSVTIGAAGSAGAAGTNNGGTGGDTSVGTLCVAKGGVGGTGASTGGAAAGSGGASASGTGDVKISGGTGGIGRNASVTTVALAAGGCGGDSILGQGAPFSGVPTAATAGIGPGGGGGGASDTNAAGAKAGGAGFAGIVIITEFCSA